LKLKVLVIEDQSPILEMLKEFVELIGYDCLCASDFESAKAVIQDKTDKIGVVICDVYLGNQNGPDLMKKLFTWIPEAVVVFTSGFSTGNFIKDSHDFPSLFLQKPFTFESLKSILEKAFSHVKAE